LLTDALQNEAYDLLLFGLAEPNGSTNTGVKRRVFREWYCNDAFPEVGLDEKMRSSIGGTAPAAVPM
jgi:hypothetical protein